MHPVDSLAPVPLPYVDAGPQVYQQGVSGGQGCCHHRRKYRYRIFVSTGTLYTLIQAGMSECMGLQVPNCSSKFSLKGKVVVLIGKISAGCRFLKF